MAIILFCRNGHDLSVYDQTVRLGPLMPRDVIRMAERARRETQQPRQPFCSRCGAPTLDACSHCTAPIPKGHRPAYCGQCGKPYPWTETALVAAKEYADELSLSSEETTALKSTLDDLAVDSARTELAAHRFKKFLQKIGPVAGDLLVKIVVDFATESSKKLLGL
jgi:hypothetical protein